MQASRAGPRAFRSGACYRLCRAHEGVFRHRRLPDLGRLSVSSFPRDGCSLGRCDRQENAKGRPGTNSALYFEATTVSLDDTLSYREPEPDP